jgi:hypothetical protein
MKTEVYSWRVSPGLKSELSRVARARKIRVSSVLDMLVRKWLAENAQDINDDDEQRRLHAVAERYFGVIKGKDPRRSERVKELVGRSLRAKYGR